ncbi:MAG: ABC transporter ATP-binding protein, partial [Oscillospiraceae bacterium]|nr:ABC transporter ATP-binding protein [Oscillospiraceae bacterium]
AGKTTLVKLLMRYYELDGGRILVDGVDIRGMSRHELRSTLTVTLHVGRISSARAASFQITKKEANSHS